MNKLIKLILFHADPPEETHFVLTPSPDSALSLLGLLPSTWQLDRVKFWDWDGRPLELQALQAEHVPGGMWVFAAQARDYPLDGLLWYRSQRARRIAESLQLQVSRSVVAGLRRLQKVGLAEQPVDLVYHAGNLFVADERSVTILNAHNLRWAPRVIRHPFRDLASFMVADQGQMLVVDEGRLKAFSLTREEQVAAPVLLDLAGPIRAIFPSRQGFYLIDASNQLHLWGYGRLQRIAGEVPAIAPVTRIVELGDGSLLLVAGRDLFVQGPSVGEPRTFYSSPEGSVLLCATAPSLLLIVDGNQVKLFSASDARMPAAVFTANGFAGTFSALSAVASDGKGRIYLVDHNELLSYQVFPRAEQNNAESQSHPFLVAVPSLPEGPFLLPEDFCRSLWGLRQDPDLGVDERRHMVIEYARERGMLRVTSGLIAVRQALEISGVDCFIGMHEQAPALFYHADGKLFRLGDDLAPIVHDSGAPIALDDVQLQELLEAGVRAEERYRDFLGTLENIHSEMHSGSQSELDPRYQEVVVERKFNIPFKVDQTIRQAVRAVTVGKTGQRERARAIFDWFQENIAYGKEKREKSGTGYFDSLEVFNHRQGVCGEMAILFISMARLAGLRANYVRVLTDHEGEKVSHACAGVVTDAGLILVDPAYHRFGIEHQDFRILDDEEFFKVFKSWDQ